MVSTVILLLIMGLVLSLTDQTSKIWKHSTAQIQSFESARAAYATMTMRLRQATLNTYLDYYDAAGNIRSASNTAFVPASYARASELHFIVDQARTIVPGTAADHPTHAVFFQAPLGFTMNTTSYANLPNILNACGYYVEFNSDKSFNPPFLDATAVKERYRYRLMEFLQPAESLAVYGTSSSSSVIGSLPAYDGWFYNCLPTNIGAIPTTQTNVPLRMLAENIIALVIMPEMSPRDASATVLAPNYTYDSRAGTISTITRNQLPPLLRVVMVAVDEPSFQRLVPSGSSTPPTVISNLLSSATPLFQTSASLDADLNTLTSALSAQKIGYRVFDTDIAIRGAKWSTQ